MDRKNWLSFNCPNTNLKTVNSNNVGVAFFSFLKNVVHNLRHLMTLNLQYNENGQVSCAFISVNFYKPPYQCHE
jgi:hypothetical protein